MMKTVLSLLVVLSTLPALAQGNQDWAKARLAASPRHGEWVAVKYGNRSVQSFVVYPEVKTKAPAIIVIHEIFGMTDWVQSAADQFAAAGYIAIAPDLLSGMAPNGGRTSDIEPSKVGEAIGKLPPDQITADLNAVADYVTKLPAANGKLAVTGFCWGGGQTFRFATNRSDISLALSFYGPPPPAEDMARIKAKVYGFYAENDARIDAMIYPKGEADMKAAGKFFEGVIYKGAGHGFMRAGEAPPPTDEAIAKNPNAKDAYAANKKAREDAWERIKAILKTI
jgi:carboxymethylenebutenolidase